MNKLLYRSMEDGFPVEIIYMKESSFSKRAILVKEIKNGYVKAFCFQKQQFRMFKIEAILTVFPYKKRSIAHYA
ncbi:hypothetical protein OIO07_09405 [Bacillus paralicheniformis]|jgi:predicted DNA-binding transcriptional regulator YafY|uniref:WYL domain-containing protein n=1 Tax=Bacillus paralicheniformis TaxID=1648923 RepID=A0A6I7TVC4_9BACI|nr:MULTISPECIES: hypothetical protein [Bacillus]ETB68915.1 hypothetical protein A943_21760 [Bacillus sp. CPSM8]KJD53667.1 hypothetical protein UZ38_31390 [Bacillus amyloliquefaciens]KUL05907.1 hypothetical protein LI7559_22580 [Bacillus licheniformis LMG 7559]KUL16483.1 hypothetical protein LI6934_15385 [Bacillus licheniformis LMG 6934]MBC8622720.1 hypothetical protein [Robertmurraya crescens]POO77670.1 hypothetical protein C1T30_37505 [Bacillus sp. MBGLi97]